MAKRFLASEYEIRGIMDGDLGVNVVHKDWYRQRFVAVVEDLLHETINLEIPFALPRDQFDSSIIPGGVTCIEDPNIIEAILECLKVDVNAEYLFSVMTGKRYRARGDEPSRLALYEPKRSRDVMLMATWPVDAPSPSNFATDEICESPVLQSASFDEDDGRGYRSATWIIRANSPLGKLLVEEAQQSYATRVQAGIEHFKNYENSHKVVRDELMMRLNSMTHDATGAPSVPRLTCYDRYMHAEWCDSNGLACDDFYFYTGVGASNVVDLANSWYEGSSTYTLVNLI